MWGDSYLSRYLYGGDLLRFEDDHSVGMFYIRNYYSVGQELLDDFLTAAAVRRRWRVYDGYSS